MSSNPEMSECVALETKLGDAIDNTTKKLESLRASKPELDAKYQAKLDTYKADVASGGHKATFPTVEREAIDATSAEMVSLADSLAKLKIEQTAARKQTKVVEAKELESVEYTLMAELVEALRPALAVNEKLVELHAKAASTHRPNAIPWLTADLLDTYGAFVSRETAPPKKFESPRDKANFIFLRYYEGSPGGSALGHICAYHINEVACFEKKIGRQLVAAGVCVEARP